MGQPGNRENEWNKLSKLLKWTAGSKNYHPNDKVGEGDGTKGPNKDLSYLPSVSLKVLKEHLINPFVSFLTQYHRYNSLWTEKAESIRVSSISVKEINKKNN